MKTHIISGLLLFVSLAALSQPLASPESIVSAAGRYFVSNIGPKLNAEKDGNGFISELAADGTLKTGHFLPTGADRLHAPKGMAIVQGVLYVTDIDRIVGFNLDSRRQVFEQPISGKTTFLNDLCAVDSRTLLFSDTFGNRVLKLDLRTKQVTAIGSALTTPNGLAYDPKTKIVYVCTMGPSLDGTGLILCKSLTNAAPFVPVPGSPRGVLDGLAVTPTGHLLVSDWQSLTAAEGRIYDVDPATGQFETLSYSGQSPADFQYDLMRHQLWIPQTLTNTIRLFALDKPKKVGQRIQADPVRLYHIGLIDGFLGGLYDGVMSYATLKQHGDFGLGAPDHLDGELTILHGRVYQTQASGHTFEPNDSASTAYAFVHPFKADTTIVLPGSTDKHQLEQALDRLLPTVNGLYAIRLTGQFKRLKTRAFPSVSQKPYAALATMLPRQHVFEYESIAGDVIGYRLPAFVNGVNIPGYHFHFLSLDRAKGGHVLDMETERIVVQVDSLAGYTVDVPKTFDYQRFNFNLDRRADIKQVERGKN